jgi:hypothetical protein
VFTLVHWDDWRLLVLEVLLAIVIIVGIMWLVRLADRGGPPQVRATQATHGSNQDNAGEQAGHPTPDGDGEGEGPQP